MIRVLPVFLRVPLAALAIALNTVVHTTPLFLVALAKALSPLSLRRRLDMALIRLAESWIAVNSGLISIFTPTRIRVEGLEGLDTDGHYLVLANHQSWVDIAVLQKVFNRRIPFLRFFLKSQLFWVPVLGLAWWALDFPFMKRYTKSQLARRPELAGQDVAATRRACEKFRHIPVALMNFVEGTRFTEAKHARQSSPYRHLLKPKAGGVAFVLDAMGQGLRSILDVSIVYLGPRPTMVDLMAGRIAEARVRVRRREIPTDLLGGNYETDRAYRARFQQWLNGLWSEKDQDIEAMRAANREPPCPSA